MFTKMHRIFQLITHNVTFRRRVFRSSYRILVIASLVLVLLASAILLAGCGGSEETPSPGLSTEVPRQVPSLPTGGTVVANGTLTPIKFVRMASNVNGEVAEILVKVGQQVYPGDVLVRLKVDEALNSELAAAKYEQIQAAQAYDALSNKHNITLTNAKNAWTDARQAQYDAERKASYQAEESSTFVKEQADWELEVAKELLQQALDRYNLLQNGPDPEEMMAVQARLDSANGRVKAAEEAIMKREFIAPIAGTVAQVIGRVNEEVNPGDEVVTVADFTAWQVETTDLNEIEVVKISQGQVVTVIPDALPDVKLTGIVQSISGISEERSGDVTYQTIISLNEGVDPRARWGMTVAVTFAK